MALSSPSNERTPPSSAATSPAGTLVRPRAHGKFLFVGDQKLWLRGVTYGTFRPDENGDMVPPRERVQSDFAEMSRLGFNAVRTYVAPPRWLFDVAAENGLFVMVDAWSYSFAAFLDDRRRKREIVDDVRQTVRRLAAHPALLCYSIANEIPGSLVRWHGARRVERYLHHLFEVIKHEDPGALVTYTSFPTTEYLRLPFLDLVCFNVYLEDRERLEAYLARLQNLSDDRPLIMGEIGLDSRRNGEDTQAETLSWQVRSVFDAGCCGAFVYAWTDEWFCGGREVDDWDFGLTRRDRSPKPALDAVRKTYEETPFPLQANWPRITVVVCSYNGEPTIVDTLEGLQKLAYPDYEVVVVNDGSTDRTAEIVARYPFRLISTENRGLSNARNRGWQEATGEIVAYIDDDAYPDPDWLTYVAHEFQRTAWVGVGGPNLPPPEDGRIAGCVANAPGGPVHVLIDDRVAEHIPGCNMAFRKTALEEIGGFDPIYRAAGDDVDLCWRLQERGGVIGFAPSAVVWHHRRNSVRTYWKQQKGYGKAEALLERKWPQRYNAMGHLAWQGRMYGHGFTRSLSAARHQIYGGIWGSAPFQSLYETRASSWLQLPLMPEWYVLVGLLAVLSLLGLSWPPLLWFTPAAVVGAALPLAQAALSARSARLHHASVPWNVRLGMRGLIFCLHLIQPAARLAGRMQHGLRPWRRRGVRGASWRLHITRSRWSETWTTPGQRLQAVHDALLATGAVTWCGGDYDDWDLTVRGGLMGSARLRFASEEHGQGKQMLRFRLGAHVSPWTTGTLSGGAILGAAALASQAWVAGVVLTALTVLGIVAAWLDASRALRTLEDAVASSGDDPDSRRDSFAEAPGEPSAESTDGTPIAGQKEE